MDSEAIALSEWQDRLKRKDQILDFVQEKALPVLLWFGFAPLVANFLGTDLGEDPITGETRE